MSLSQGRVLPLFRVEHCFVAQVCSIIIFFAVFAHLFVLDEVFEAVMLSDDCRWLIVAGLGTIYVLNLNQVYARIPSVPF